MFGYIKPDKPELKIKEYQYFRAYYCGLCKALGKRMGQISRFTVSYDSAFAALFLASLHDEQDEISFEPCIIDPVRKKPVIRNSRFIDYAADMNVVLTYYKLMDDWHNERSWPALVAAVALRRQLRSAAKNYGAKVKYIEDKLIELNDLEAQRCAVVDEAAEPFACMMRELMDYPGSDVNSEQRAILGDVAYDLGRWIYILDAYDDLDKDAASGSYNPLLVQFGYSGQDIMAFKADVRDWVRFNLTYTLSRIEASYRRLDIKRNRAVLDNFIYLGLYRTMDNILEREKCVESVRGTGGKRRRFGS